MKDSAYERSRVGARDDVVGLSDSQVSYMFSASRQGTNGQPRPVPKLRDPMRSNAVKHIQTSAPRELYSRSEQSGSITPLEPLEQFRG
jgi:hypothetical protein